MAIWYTSTPSGRIPLTMSIQKIHRFYSHIALQGMQWDVSTTLTPDIIDRLGFFDEASFPVRGHSHVDYTIRACRIEGMTKIFSLIS